MIEVPIKEIPIKTSGPCIDKLVSRLQKKIGEEDTEKLRKTAVEVVQNCVKYYVAKFGEGDVGINGTGIVSNPYKGKTIPLDTTGLIYGRVQSGKTNTTIASLALAQENGFKCFIVLTSNNTWLGSQTASRFNSELRKGPTLFNWENWRNDYKYFANHLLSYSLHDKGVVLVTTKELHHLERLIEVLRLSKAKEVPTLIFDDEADNASLDNNEGKKSDGKYEKASTTFDLIRQIRQEVSNHIYIQITATPQSLLLQNLDHPCKPRFCAAIPEPGEDYMGGELFFNDDSKYCCEVDSKEIKQLKEQDDCKTNPGGRWHIPRGLKMALCCFFLGAVYKMQSDDDGKYSFLAHICYKKDNHKNLEKIISNFVRDLISAIQGKSPSTQEKEAYKLLTDAYQELSKTAFDLPPLNLLIDELKDELHRVLPQVKVINSSNSDKEPSYNPGMNILIGGNRLGRGVTIEGLIVTYYGREAKQKIMDTVHQHARMYGYRQNLKDVTRLFLPKEILKDFKSIHEADKSMRKAIGNDPNNIKIKPVWVGKKLKPTRSQVLNLAYIDSFIPGQAVLPSNPLFNISDVRQNTEHLNQILSPYNDDNQYYEVNIDFLIEVLRYIPSKPCSDQKWEDKRIEEALKNLKLNGIVKGMLNVRRGKKCDGLDLSNKTRPWNGAFAQSAWISEPKEKYPKLPTLVIMYQKGEKKKGWDDHPFYLPTLIFPQNQFIFMFNYLEEEELESDDLAVLDDDSEN